MNDNNRDNNDRRLPPPLDEKLVSNKFRNGKVRQDALPKAPIRAIRVKGDQLRAAIHGRNARRLDGRISTKDT